MIILDAKITSKGQITLPLPIRKALGLVKGDKLRISVEGDHIVATPNNKSLRDLKGSLAQKNKPTLSCEEMNEVIRSQYDRN